MTDAAEPMDLRVENGSLLTQSGRLDGGYSVAIDGERIAAVGQTDTLPAARQIIDAGGGIIAPGVVDEHVHDRSLGQSHKEDWETLTRSAAAGGVTTVLGHGNTDPYVERPADIERKLSLAERDALVDFGCFAWVTKENYDRLAPLAAAGAVGFQASLSERPLDSGQLITAMKNCAQTDCRFGLHTEDGDIIDSRWADERTSGRDRPIDHCRRRPVTAETVGARTAVELARQTDCPLHVFLVSAGSTLDPLVRAKESGLDITVETCPHYLRFTDAEMATQGSVAVVSPPLRDAAEREQLWEQGIDGGAIDCIGTDHAPHTDAEKRIDEPFESIRGISPGFVGLETAVPMLLTFAADGRLGYSQWRRLHSEQPARVWGLYPTKGSLQVGTDADITVVDPDQEWTFSRSSLRSKGTVTPFEDERFQGTVETTIVRGRIVYRDGEVVGDPGWGARVERT